MTMLNILYWIFSGSMLEYENFEDQIAAFSALARRVSISD
jgi:hypothetical protein